MKKWQRVCTNSKEAYVPDWCRKYDGDRFAGLLFQGLTPCADGGGNSSETEASSLCHAVSGGGLVRTAAIARRPTIRSGSGCDLPFVQENAIPARRYKY